MAATPDPTPSEQTLLTFFSARIGDLHELVDQRMENLNLQLQHDRDLQAREHEQMKTLLGDQSRGIGELRDRFDRRLDAHAKRIKDLESANDQRVGGRRSLRELVATAAAAVAVGVGLRGFHIL